MGEFETKMIDQAMENKEQIAMWVADPGFPPDKRIKEAFDFAVEKGCTHYFPAKGFELCLDFSAYADNSVDLSTKLEQEIIVKTIPGSLELLPFQKLS
jgi:aspartate/methionine/tyrosine aminotransferase